MTWSHVSCFLAILKKSPNFSFNVIFNNDDSVSWTVIVNVDTQILSKLTAFSVETEIHAPGINWSWGVVENQPQWQSHPPTPRNWFDYSCLRQCDTLKMKMFLPLGANKLMSLQTHLKQSAERVVWTFVEFVLRPRLSRDNERLLGLHRVEKRRWKALKKSLTRSLQVPLICFMASIYHSIAIWYSINVLLVGAAACGNRTAPVFAPVQRSKCGASEKTLRLIRFEVFICYLSIEVPFHALKDSRTEFFVIGRRPFTQKA